MELNEQDGFINLLLVYSLTIYAPRSGARAVFLSQLRQWLVVLEAAGEHGGGPVVRACLNYQRGIDLFFPFCCL